MTPQARALSLTGAALAGAVQARVSWAVSDGSLPWWSAAPASLVGSVVWGLTARAGGDLMVSSLSFDLSLSAAFLTTVSLLSGSPPSPGRLAGAALALCGIGLMGLR